MSLLCRINRHDWQVKVNRDGPYQMCSRCGHYRNETSWLERVQGLDGPPAGEGRPPSSDPPRPL